MRSTNIDSGKNSTFISKNFLFLLIANTISSLGDYIYQIGIVVYLYKETSSPTVIGGYFISQFIPSLIFTPIAGALIDRWDKKHILIYTNIIRAVAVGFLFIHLSTEAIYIIAIILGINDDVFEATKNSIIPHLAEDDEVVRANSLFSATDSSTMIIGPTIAGVLITSTGIYGSIGINAISFVIAAILILFIKSSQYKIPLSEKNFFKDIKEGLQIVVKNTLVKRIILIWGIFLTGIGATSSLLIFLLSDYMKLPSNSYGWVMTTEGIGIVVSSLILIRKKDKVKYTTLIQFGLIAIGGALIVISLTSNLGIVLIAYIIVGLGAAAAPTGLRSTLQTKLPKEILGRVYISVRFIITTLRTLSIACASILTKLINLRTIFLIAAVLILFAGFIARIFNQDSKNG